MEPTTNLPVLAGFWVQAKKHPLATDVVRASVPRGLTIREVIACDGNDFAVTLDDEYVPAELWATMRPAVGQTLFVCPIPRNDNVKQMLLVAGLIAAAMFGGGAIASAFTLKAGALGFSSAGFLGNAALWQAGIMAGGSLLLTALVKPPTIE